MNYQSIMSKDKLEAGGILRQSLAIPIKNPKFLTFTLLTSLPLSLSLLFEFLFQETLAASIRILLSDTSYWDWAFLLTKRVIAHHYHQFALLGLTYLILVHPLDLLNTILILSHSSALYAGDALQSLLRPIKDSGFKGPLVTSLYALLLSSLVSLGLISLGMHLNLFQGLGGYYYYMEFWEIAPKLPLLLLFGGFFLALLVKYIEWSAVWNVGIMISVLEQKHGDIAIGVAAYLSRGSRRRGFLLMLVFFLWRLGLRLLCLYFVLGYESGRVRVGATVAQVACVCLGNLMKWVVVMVYYCDCKKRFLEQKIDLENGKLAVGE